MLVRQALCASLTTCGSPSHAVRVSLLVVPLAQAVQLPAPAPAAMVPGAHTVQGAVPPGLELPAAHKEQVVVAAFQPEPSRHTACALV